jgi:hypothetical protein
MWPKSAVASDVSWLWPISSGAVGCSAWPKPQRGAHCAASTSLLGREGLNAMLIRRTEELCSIPYMTLLFNQYYGESNTRNDMWTGPQSDYSKRYRGWSNINDFDFELASIEISMLWVSRCAQPAYPLSSRVQPQRIITQVKEDALQSGR